MPGKIAMNNSGAYAELTKVTQILADNTYRYAGSVPVLVRRR
jgi:hypothetical protein